MAEQYDSSDIEAIRSLSEIEDLRLSSIPYEHHVSTLAVTAVLAGLKGRIVESMADLLATGLTRVVKR